MEKKAMLKPCPFCGEKRLDEAFLSVLWAGGPSPYRIHCCCGAEGPWDKKMNGAIAAWNRRVKP